MRRRHGIYFFVGGLAVILLALREGVSAASPTYLLTGLLAVFVGAVVFGLGFIRPHDPGPDAPLPLPFGRRIAGLFYDPYRVFDNLRHNPRWLGTFLLLALCAYAYEVAFYARVGPEAAVEARIERAVAGGWLDLDLARFVKARALSDFRSPLASLSTQARPIGSTFLKLLALAALYLLGARTFGGRLNFWQSLAVTVNAQFPAVFIEKAASFILLFTLPPERIDLVRGQQGLLRLDLAALGQVQSPVVYALVHSVGVFALYYLWLVATGLERTGEGLGAARAWAVVSVVWGLGVAGYVAAALLSPRFVM